MPLVGVMTLGYAEAKAPERDRFDRIRVFPNPVACVDCQPRQVLKCPTPRPQNLDSTDCSCVTESNLHSEWIPPEAAAGIECAVNGAFPLRALGGDFDSGADGAPIRFHADEL